MESSQAHGSENSNDVQGNRQHYDKPCKATKLVADTGTECMDNEEPATEWKMLPLRDGALQLLQKNAGLSGIPRGTPRR